MTTSADSWLQDLGSLQIELRRGVVVRHRADGQLQLLASWPGGSRPDAGLLGIALNTVQGAYPIQQALPTADGACRAFPLPVRMGNQIRGAVVIEASDSPALEPARVFAGLQGQLEALEQTLAQDAPDHAGPAEILSLQTALLSHRRFPTAATALANELANLLRCDRVSIGMMRNGTTRLEAVSHSNSERHGGDDFMAITAAMDECFDQQSTIIFPPPGGAPPRITLAHAELARRGRSALLTLPLVEQSQVFGAVTLERMQGMDFAQEEVTGLEHVMGLLGPLLAVKREADTPVSKRIQKGCTSAWRKLTGRGHIRFKAVTTAAVLTLALLTLVPVDYRVTAPVRVEGQVQRVLSAPYDGFLESVHVRPGDRVQAGQILVELDRQDLFLDLRRWQSELAKHENTYGAAMFSGDRAKLANSLASLQEVRAKVDLVQGQLDRAQVKAPFDGVVISGDLSQSLEMPVERGSALLTVAPIEGRRLIIEVDERDVARVHPGQRGEFALRAMPGNTLELSVQRITPVASSRNKRNFFAVEAVVTGSDPGLRPGLEGIAKIDAGRRSIAWVWLHRVGDWLRLGLWRWLG